MQPSPIIARSAVTSPVGVVQSETWKPQRRSPARAISRSTVASQNTWYASHTTPTAGERKRSASALASSKLVTTERSAIIIGCNGSIASRTPLAAAS